MIGARALFSSEAEKRFRNISSDRFHGLASRMKRKGLPLTFSLDAFRGHLLSLIGGSCDGVCICRYCRQPLDLSEVAVDHAEPLSRGGLPGLDNLELICQACNDRKGGLLPLEYERLMAFLESDIPLARAEVLKRLQQSTKLAAGMRHNMARIGELKKSGEWQKAGKKKRRAAVEEDSF